MTGLDGIELSARMHRAIETGLLDGLRACLEHGADPDALDQFGDPGLPAAISRILDPAARLQFVRTLLEHGADPRRIREDGGGPLFAAMIQNDAEVMKLLLENGAQPNVEHDMGEPLFDWSEFHYRNDEYDLHLPESPLPPDKASASAWVSFLDRLAVKYGRPRPECLKLIVEYGARGWPDQKPGEADGPTPT